MLKSKASGNLIDKLQYFADAMDKKKCEKEIVAIGMNRGECKEVVKNQIILYEEIIEEYHDIFKELLYENN